MAFQFPASPILNQIFTPLAGVSFQWNGTGWAPYQTAFATQAQGDARYILLTEKAAASGVASLDTGTKVPITQLPAGTASGVASLDATGKVPVAQVPFNRTRQVFTSGSGTYTTPANCRALNVRMVGGGGGGAASTTGAGGTGGNTTFGALTANGGSGGSAGGSAGGAPGGASGGDINVSGGQGGGGQNPGVTINIFGGTGGQSMFGGAGNSQGNAPGV